MDIKNFIKLGKKYRAWDAGKGKWRNWGEIIKISGNEVELYTKENPVNYKYRIEKVEDILRWKKEGLIK